MGNTWAKACYPEETLFTGCEILLWDPFSVPSLALFLFSFLASSLQSSIFYFFFLLLQQHSQQQQQQNWPRHALHSVVSPLRPRYTIIKRMFLLLLFTRIWFYFMLSSAYIDVTKQITMI